MSYLGLDPLWVSIAMGVFIFLSSITLQSYLQTKWFKIQILILALLPGFVFVGWFTTSQPWILSLYLTMLFVTYGSSQLLTNLFIFIERKHNALYK